MSIWRRSGVVVVVALAAMTLGACTGFDLGGDEGAVPGDLRWRRADVSVICDGTDRKAGTIEQAEADEGIEFASPLPIEIPAGEADAEGHYPLMWSCEPEEASLRWDLTATGAESGRTVAFTVVGAPMPAEERALDVELYVDELVCDGERTEVGVLDGLDVSEIVYFESDQGEASAQPKAAGDGTLVFGWRCRPADVGKTWEVMVTAAGTDRTATFRLTGLPDPSASLDVTIESAEAEVRCDGEVMPLATLANFFPFETVTFTADPPASDLRNGTADGNGGIELQWQCGREDVGKTWNLTAEGVETGKSISFTFNGVAGGPIPPATVRLIEDPFVCDGGRRPVAELGELAAGEFVDFTSPQTDGLRDGQASPSGGRLDVNWQCDPTELEGADTKVWEVTATGRESLRSVTFTITGVPPGQP